MNLRITTTGIIVASGFEDSQVIKAAQILRFRGVRVVVIATGASEGAVVTGLHGSVLKPDMSLTDISVAELDAVIIPGGDSTKSLKANDRVLTLLLEMQREGKPIGAICNGPVVLAAAGLVRGRRVTGDKVIKTELRESGARYVNQGLVVDHNIVTSQSEGNLSHFIDAISFLLEPAASLH